MPAQKKKVSSSRTSKTAQTNKTPKPAKGLKDAWLKLKTRAHDFLARRPHRSFRRTLRRDYARSLKMPGYWVFTNEVRRLLWQNKKLFLLLALTYGILNAALVGLASQDTYAQLSAMLHDSGANLFGGDWNAVGGAGVLLAASAAGFFNQEPTDAQRIFAALLVLMAWLTTVWLIRSILSGQKPKLRDGLYNGSASLLSTFLVGFVIVLQLLPVAIAAIGFGATISSGILDGGVEAMIFWLFASLLVLLSLYWITSSVIALVVVTLPGMYPMRALRTAGDLVVGRRSRILLRLLWTIAWVAVIWAVIMIPVILFDGWIKSVWPVIDWLPIVPVLLAALSALTVVWMAAYVYLLYRKVVDDGAAPA